MAVKSHFPSLGKIFRPATGPQLPLKRTCEAELEIGHIGHLRADKLHPFTIKHSLIPM